MTVGHKDLANAIRALAIDAVEAANSGHPGLPMGAADMATVLFRDVLRFDANAPDWPDRDRFVLSAGHGSMLLYALLHLTGVAGVTLEELKRFRQFGSKTPGHPEYGHTPGVEVTTGPLGQGLATAVGMAMAERKLAAAWGAKIVDHHTYVIASDGDLMEGVSHEAAHLAGRLKLSRLIVLFDDNAISIDGDTALAETGDAIKRFEAAGWRAERIDGHDPAAVKDALLRAKAADRPSLIAAKTTIGLGAPTKAGTAGVHGAPLGAQEAAAAKKALGCDWPAFDIPEDVRAAWAAIGRKGEEARTAWEARFAALPEADRARFERAQAGKVDAGALASAVEKVKMKAAADKPAMATRKASGETLTALAEALPELIGGSADLTGSNNTRAPGQTTFDTPDYAGSYVHYGVREHAMAAAMNGMALHGGLRPYGGTFLVFSDYCRPALRLAALMGTPTIFVFTHDSIGLGEDGPTHQPVEHLPALRTIPNLNVFRPADLIETAEAWEIALATTDRPSCLVLSRQNAPALRTDSGEENLSAAGAYVLMKEAGSAPEITLVGTGTELALAVEARETLAQEGVDARVVSAPCLDLFADQDAGLREAVVPTDRPAVAVEAALGFGLGDLLGRLDGFVGMTGFGASAPAGELYDHFGVTAAAVVEAARRALERGAKKA